jgi:GxxExxY protein
MQYETITELVIGCAYRVDNQMGFGFLESAYEKCMAIDRILLTSIL